MEIGKRKAAQRLISNLFSGLAIIAISLMLVRSYLPTTLEKVLTEGQLRVISRNGPTTYYEGPEGLTGFEYSLVKGFADELGVELVIQDEDSFGRIFNAVGEEQNHLAAAGITVTPTRSKGVKFTRPFMKVKQQLIYNSRQPAPRDILDLMGKDLVVISESSHVERLQELRETYPELTWREEPALEMIELLEMIHKGEADYAIVDSNSYDLNRHAYPRAQTAFDISDAQDLAWAFAHSIDTSLFDAAQAYLDRVEQNGTLATLTDQFYKPIVEVTTGDALLFSYRLEKRLPRWEEGLKEAAAKFDLDWQLLAAISYQESHWNPTAESRTGVRGLMMLTLATASDMGVKDRIDPSQSIYGGAKYFRNLLDRIPARVTGDDRIYMALAAYNVGMGHLEDARVLTEIHGDDPNKWSDVRKHLPLLAKRQYYSKTRHGYARGWEPVAYVKNVRNYHKILAWHSQHEQRRLAVTHGEKTDGQTHLPSETLQPVKSKFSRNSFNTSSLSVL